jgi:hypothetical protein
MVLPKAEVVKRGTKNPGWRECLDVQSSIRNEFPSNTPERRLFMAKLCGVPRYVLLVAVGLSYFRTVSQLSSRQSNRKALFTKAESAQWNKNR